MVAVAQASRRCLFVELKGPFATSEFGQVDGRTRFVLRFAKCLRQKMECSSAPRLVADQERRFGALPGEIGLPARDELESLLVSFASLDFPGLGARAMVGIAFLSLHRYPSFNSHCPPYNNST